MNEEKLREAIREIIRDELQEATLTPFQKKIKKLFAKSGGKMAVDKIAKIVKGHSEEWQELRDKSYVGQKPGEKVWHWV